MAGILRSKSSSIQVKSYDASVRYRFPQLTHPPTAGKILKDEDTIESCKIEEKGFVVCMVSKVSKF